MSGSLREILPRQELRKFDRLPGAYPTIARTGDFGRLGSNNVFFDDLNIVTFVQTGSTVSYPTTLRVSSKYLLPDMTSNITASRGDVDRNAIENWLVLPSQVEPFRPYDESRLFSQDLNKTGSFYLTGSDVSQVGLGFSSPLGSKTQVKLTIPVRTDVKMDPVNAAVYYFNNATAKFEEIGASFKRSSATAVSAEPAYPMNDALMFGPFGNNTYSQFEFLPPFNGSNIGTTLAQALSLSPADMVAAGAPAPVLNNGVFAPTGSYLISLTGSISQPFLIEKVIMEVPVKAGNGWFTDLTQYRSVSNGTLNWIDDGGGPVIVFGLLNAFPDRRDLILSATVIPSGDNIVAYRSDSIADNANRVGGGTILLRSLNGYASRGTPTAVLQSASNGAYTGSVRMLVQPAVSNGIVSQKNFFGSTNGIGAQATLQASFAALVNPFGRAQYPLQPSGRSYFGKEYTIANAAKFDFTLSKVKKLFGRPVAGTYDYPDEYYYEDTQVSPYLVMPTDKLVFFASKYRPINSNNGNNTFTISKQHDFVLAAGTIRITLYGSLISDGQEYHDTLNQRLETNEVHETVGFDPIVDRTQSEYFQVFSGSMMAEQLTGSLFLPATSSVGLVIPGVYTPSSRSIWADATNTGSYSQTLEIIETSRVFVIPDLNGGTINAGDNPANYSDLKTKKKEKYSMFRNMTVTSPNERFYDSLVPSINEAIDLNGGTLVGVTYVFNPCSAHPTPIGPPIVQLTFDVNTNESAYSYDTIGLNTEITWTKSFPFEPRYSSLIRRVDAGSVYYRHQLTYGCGFGSIALGPHLNFYQPIFAQKVLVSAGPVYRWGGDTWGFYSYISQTQRRDALAKLIYGFGDLNTYPNDSTLAAYGTNCGAPGTPSSTSKLYGCTNFPEPRMQLQYGGINSAGVTNGQACPASNVYRGALIRGWKYGLINAFPQFTKAIFDPKRFGQPRNMLEQRLDSKFYESLGYKFDGTLGGNVGAQTGPVQVKFINQKGEITKPEFTYSSNLSYEATSSLPYFDGVVRNREDPIYTPSLGLTVVT